MAESTKKQKLVVRGFALSLDGFSSASGQGLESPFGNGGLVIMEWAFQTRTMKTMFGQEGGSTGIDDSFLAKGFDNIGANLGRGDLFGPTCAGLGLTRSGKVGGAPIRPTIRRFLS